MKLLNALKPTFQRASNGFPWTPLGIASALLFAVLLKTYAFQQLDLVWLVVSYGALGLLAVSTLLVIAGTLRVHLGLRSAARAPGPKSASNPGSSNPENTVVVDTIAGQTATVPFPCPTLARWPLIRLRRSWAQPHTTDVRATTNRTEQARLHHRVHTQQLTRHLIIEDVLGLCRVTLTRTHHQPLRCLPHTGTLNQLPRFLSMTGGDEIPHPMGIDDGDRTDIRRYVAGDPARFLHWKVFGRTRKLMVRIPERALSQSRRTVAYFVAGPGDEPTAGVATHMLTANPSSTPTGLGAPTGLGIEWTFQADGQASSTRHPHGAIDQILKASTTPNQQAAGLHTFVQTALKEGPAQVLVFAPHQAGPWVEQVQALVRTQNVPVQILIGVDGWRTPEPPRWMAPLKRHHPPPPEWAQATKLHATLQQLGRSHCHVHVVDRMKGREISPQEFTP